MKGIGCVFNDVGSESPSCHTRNATEQDDQSTVLTESDLQQNIKIVLGEDDRGRLPKGGVYDPLIALEKVGVTFKPIDLLHVLGCKLAKLPSTELDRCISAAGLYRELLVVDSQKNLNMQHLHDPDVQGPRSQELGIGLSCLLANQAFSVPWEALEPIVAPGRRFDYRGEVARPDGSTLKLLIEAKGTTDHRKQDAKIGDGLDKKAVWHAKGRPVDVELVVSVHVPYQGRGRIIVADPPMDDVTNAFWDGAPEFFRLRHYARAATCAGAPAIGMYLRREADALRRFLPEFEAELLSVPPGSWIRADLQGMAQYRANDQVFLGQWLSTAKLPREPKHRRRHQWIIEKAKGTDAFLGIDRAVLGPLLSLAEEAMPKDARVSEGRDVSSVFNDGTILVIRSG